MIDATDRQILNELQSTARMSNAEIARRLEMAPSAIHERLRKLEARGILECCTTRINPRAVGLDQLAFVHVRATDAPGSVSTGEELAAIPNVLEVHHIAGDDCFLVKVRTRDTSALGRLLRERIGALESVVSTRTIVVLDTVKETGDLPLDQVAGEEAS